MSHPDDFRKPDRPSGDHLLNELESIKGTLDGGTHPSDALDPGDDDLSGGDIPLLDDMVINGLDANIRLLNLEQIFEEEFEEGPTRTEVETAESEWTSISQRDVVIQELVDEFIPRIEAALRERLSRIDIRTLQGWKDRK